MNQQPPWYAQQQPQYPQVKPPHLYGLPLLVALVTSYILSFVFVGIGAEGQNSTNPNSEPILLTILTSLGVILLLCLHGCIIILDGHNFFTLNGRISWKQLKGWPRLGLIFVYLCFWIMPAIYLTIAIKRFLEAGQLRIQPNTGVSQQPQQQTRAAFPPQFISPMPLPRSIGRRIFKIMLYFIGVFIAIFGAFGVATYASNNRSQVESIALLFGFGAAVISLFIFFLRRYHIHCLPWSRYLLWTVGTTFAALITFILVFAFSNPNTNWIAGDVAASILLLYGLSLISIAYMKPSLPQQVNESVYRILKAAPGKQMVISDVLARLQKEYKQQDTTLIQYLGKLDYVEQANIPGTPVIIYRMKAPKQTVAVPQLAPFPAYPFQPQAPSISRPTPASPAPILKETPVPSPVQTSVPADSSLEDVPTTPLQSISAHTTPNVMPVSLQVQNDAVSNLDTDLKEAATPLLVESTAVNTPKPNVMKDASPMKEEPRAVKIFCCYAHQDEQLLNKLKNHLMPQQRQGLIHIWYDREISAGSEWEREIDEQLNSAQIILILVSPDFIASDYCYSKEMQRAIERHDHGEVRAIPIILRPTDWKITPLGKLQALPKDGKPITIWSNRDNAFLDVAKGIRSVVEAFLTPPQQDKRQPQTVNNQQQVAEAELTRVRCKQGKLIVTNKRIIIELSTFGQVLKSQMLLRTSLTSVDSKLAVAPLFGKGGGVNLTFHGKGRELLQADLVPPKEAQEIIALLS